MRRPRKYSGWREYDAAHSLRAEAKALAKKLGVTVAGEPLGDDYFDGLSEATLRYLCLSMSATEQEREGRAK